MARRSLAPHHEQTGDCRSAAPVPTARRRSTGTRYAVQTLPLHFIGETLLALTLLECVVGGALEQQDSFFTDTHQSAPYSFRPGSEARLQPSSQARATALPLPHFRRVLPEPPEVKATQPTAAAEPTFLLTLRTATAAAAAALAVTSIIVLMMMNHRHGQHHSGGYRPLGSDHIPAQLMGRFRRIGTQRLSTNTSSAST